MPKTSTAPVLAPRPKTLRTRVSPLVRKSSARRERAQAVDEAWRETLAEPLEPNAADELVQESAPAPVATRFAPRAAALAPAPAPTLAPTLALTELTYADYDRVWDWCRANPQGAHDFLGHVPEHSRALSDYLDQLGILEREGKARVRSLYIADVHIGIASLFPIVRTGTYQPHGYAHCMLSPQTLGHLPKLLPILLDAVSALEPTLTLKVIVTDIAFTKLLEPHGFTTEITLTRPPQPLQE